MTRHLIEELCRRQSLEIPKVVEVLETIEVEGVCSKFDVVHFELNKEMCLINYIECFCTVFIMPFLMRGIKSNCGLGAVETDLIPHFQTSSVIC